MLVDVSHEVEHGMVTYKGLRARSSATSSAESSPARIRLQAPSSTSARSYSEFRRDRPGGDLR